MTIKRITSALFALLALLVAVAPAAATAKPAPTLHYEGETAGGLEMEFSLTGKRLSEINGYVQVTCVPTHGVPLSYREPFNPAGSFVIGQTKKVSATEYMSYKGDVTKYYTVDFKRRGRMGWVTGIHVNYSYEEVSGFNGLELEKHFYICQGDDSFSFKLEGPAAKH